MLQLFKKNYYLFLFLLLGIGSTSGLFSQNLITNGNFGTFNASVPKPPAVGYQSNYNQINYNQGNSIPIEYAITNDAFSVNTTNFISIKDHTTGNGTGNMMVVDGDSNEIFWKQNPDRQLLAGQAYVFSFWIANVAISGNPKATIRFNPSGCSSCSSSTIDLNTLPAGWNKVSFTITPSTTQWVRIELSTVGAGGGGNDFAIDDISLFGPPLPIAISSSQTNPTCIAASDGAIIAYGAGGIQPYTYQLSGTATATNTTGIFTGLAAGNYNVAVTDSDSTPKTISTGTINLAEPTPITITPSVTGCILTGTAVQLTANGGTAPYTWTANIGANPSGTTNIVTVNPTTTTTYSVSSTINSTLAPSNLITNGDFENLNNGFSSDYGYYPSGNPSGAYIAYGITTDPSTWYPAFGKYVDHTTGTGKMLVCDGATDGTSVIWSQTVATNPGTNYNFSFYAQNLTNNNYAKFKATINGIDVTLTPISAGNTGAASNGSLVGGGWTQITGTWAAGAASLATLKIINTTVSGAGNDFSLDDISFMAQTAINKSCTLSKSIILNVGGSAPITNFSYSTPICKNNTNPLPVLASGFKTGGTFSSTTGLTINSTTGEIDLASSTSGTYTITYNVAADAVACTTAGSSNFLLVINAVPTITSIVNNSRCSSGTVLLQANSSSGTVNWYTNAIGGGAIATGSTYTTPSLSATTTYYVDATANGCTTNSRTAVVATVNALPSVPTYIKTTPTCSTPTGTITITGPTPLTDYQFSLDGGTFSSTISYSNVIPGNHTLESKLITTNCQSGTTTVAIAPIPTGPTAIASTINPATCGSNNGSITLGTVTGGTAGFTYSFDSSAYASTLNYSGLASGDHTVVIKDANDCLSPVIVLNVPSINSPAQPSAVATAHPTCTNANAGEITITIVAGLTYSIDGSDYSNTSGIFSGLASGTYFVTAKNATGCISPTTIVGINNQPITPVLVITNPSPVCSPTTIDLTATSITAGSTGGGTLSYWTNAAATTPLLTPTSVATSGTYYIKSTVNGNCSDIQPVTVIIRTTEIITISCGSPTMNSVTFNWNTITDATGFTYSSTINGLTGPSGMLAASVTNLTISSLSPGDAVILTLNPSGSNCVQTETSAPCFTLVCPLPTVDPISNSIVCSGDSIPLQAFTSIPVDPSTTYNWTITNNIGSPLVSGTGSIPSFITSNTTSSSITATITVRGTQGACTGPATTYSITVQPQPVITVTNPAPVCAPTTVNITTAFTATGGGTISYWNDAAASIPLTNPNAVAASGTYYIKSTVGSSTTCTDIRPVIVTIRPTEIITIACGTATLNSVTFNWNSISDATGFSYSSTINGIAGPSGTLVATATTLTIPGLLPNDAVQLTLTPTGSNCVQPATSGICNALPCNNPVVTPMANLVVCSGASIPQQTFSSTPIDLINTKYFWSMTNTIGAPALSGIGNIPSFTALNNTNSAITATIQVYAEQLGPCIGPIMTYTITVQPQPIITVTNPAAVCAPATVDITTAFTATGGGTISYWNDAAASIPLTNPNAIAASGTYYIKSTVGSSTTCTDIRPVNVTINTQPLANQPNALTICDDNNDGFGIFDLSNTTLLNEINSSAGVTISFHETQQNAINNVFAYTGLYNNNVKDNQTLYVRVSSNSTTCYALTTLQLKVNAKPLATLLAKPYELCDDNQDGFMTFNLRSLDSQILGANNASTHTVAYFKNSTDAINNTNAISNASSYTNTIPNSETVFARVTQNTLGCFDVTSFTINVIALPTAILPTEYMLCDDASGNEIELFDLTTKINEITGGNTSLKVQFFRSQSEALANSNPITNITSFANTINSQTLFVSVTNTSTNCTSYTTLTLRVMPLPKPNTTPTTLQLCDSSTNNLGTATFDLTLAENEIKNGDVSLVLEYYTNKIDAESGNTSNRISNPSQFTNTTVNQNIYVRVSTSPANPNDIKCATVVTLPLKVNLLPGFNNVSNYVLCEPNTDGFMTFDFSNKTVEMLNTVSNPNDYKISYFDSQVNAINNTNPLSNLYTNTTAFSQNIYVRIDNLVTNCSSTSNSLQLIVEEGAATTSVTNAQSSFCDTDDTNDGKMTLNLTAFNTLLLGTNPVSNYQITYFTNLNDAQLNNNPIPNPSSYLSAIPFSYMVYARITNIVSASKCTAIEAITITINPQILPKPIDGIICVDPISGATIRNYIIDSTLPTTGYTYQWSFNGTVLPLEQNATLVANKAGSYSLIATNTLTGCSSKEVKIEVKSSQSANASYILTRSFSKEQMFTVSVSNGTIEDYSYQLDQGEIQLSPIFNGVTPGPHQITIRDLDGCQETILDAYALDFPNFFTPNGDGYNDTWNISDLSNQPNAVIYIFDRFGKLLNEIRPQGNGWDGTYNRNDLPATDYWFKVIFEENGKMVEFKSHFSLKR